MFLKDLMVMQSGLRNIDQIEGMIDFVEKGGFWTNEVLKHYALENNRKVCPLIEIVCFPNNQYMIHDGTHRSVSIYLAGRNYLRFDEYLVKKWTYQNYLEISFENNWVTPFDPRTEIKIADIGEFKKKALEISKISLEESINFIRNNKDLYIVPRTVHFIEDLVRKISLQKRE